MFLTILKRLKEIKIWSLLLVQVQLFIKLVRMMIFNLLQVGLVKERNKINKTVAIEGKTLSSMDNSAYSLG